jgi:hypothetical protein
VTWAIWILIGGFYLLTLILGYADRRLRSVSTPSREPRAARTRQLRLLAFELGGSILHGV